MLIGDMLKSKGMALSLLNSGDWKDRALSALEKYIHYRIKYCNGDNFGMDQFRMWATILGMLDEPKSQNSWGSVPRIAIKAGLIEETQEYSKSIVPSAHRRPVKLWRIV